MGRRALICEREGKSRDEIYEAIEGLMRHLPNKKTATVENQEKQLCMKIANERKWDSGNRWFHYQRFLPRDAGDVSASGNTGAVAKAKTSSSSSSSRPSAAVMAAVAASLVPGTDGLTTEGSKAQDAVSR